MVSVNLTSAFDLTFIQTSSEQRIRDPWEALHFVMHFSAPREQWGFWSVTYHGQYVSVWNEVSIDFIPSKIKSISCKGILKNPIFPP